MDKYNPRNNVINDKVGIKDFLKPICRTVSEMDREPIEYYLWLFETPEFMKPTIVKANDKITKQYNFSLQWGKTIKNLIIKYQSLSASERKYIHAARQDGVYWRGEGMELFRKVYTATLKYKNLKSDQKRQYQTNLLRVVEKMRAA
mgnify:CR=1 FL=1